MAKTYSTCEATSLTRVVQIASGTLLIAGLAAVLWIAATRRGTASLNPQDEIDRRINDLEHSLTRLQDVFGQSSSG